MRLVLAGHTIEAVSIGGVETCYQLPEFDVCLDIGRCPPGAELRSKVLLTHAHIDHAAGLPYYVSMRALTSMKAPDVYCPKPSHDALQQILDLWTTLQADSNRCTLHAVEPGDRIELGRAAYATVFRSPHRIATVGYTIHSTKKKLKKGLEHLTGEQIGERARAGEEVNEIIHRAEICFPGDTMIDVVEREPAVTTARVLLLECTFFAPKVERDKARRTGHVHFDELAERAHLFQNEVVLLTHFSRRHSRTEIEDAVRSLPKALRDRVQLLLE
jgi:ribonuclease Z